MTLPTVQFSASSLATALVKTVVPTAPTGGGGGYLKFDGKNGGWSFGRDAEAVDGEVVLINTASIGHGFVLWIDGVPDKVLSRFNEPMPEPQEPQMVKIKKQGRMVEELKYPDECRTVQGAFLSDKTGVTFETSSTGGRQAVDNLLAAIKQKAVSGSQYLFPAVELAGTSYDNKTYGTVIHNPVFTVVSWHDQDGNAEGQTEQLAQSAPEAVEAAPEAVEAAPEAEAPTRRRRVV